MSELVVIVEGETEQSFVRDQLAAHLALLGTIAWAVLPGRHRNHGGVKRWEVARQDIIRTLKEKRYCSTMIDYYAMPDDWPGRVEAKALPWNQRATHVESRVAEHVVAATGINPKFFIPYVQLHEFESLAFADVSHLVSVVAPVSELSEAAIEKKLVEVLKQAGHPEAINDGYETCPSRRIRAIFHPENSPVCRRARHR